MASSKYLGDIENVRTREFWIDNRDKYINAVANLPIINDTNVLRNSLDRKKYKVVSLRSDSPYIVPIEIGNLIKYRHEEIGFIKGLMYAVSAGDTAVAKHVFAKCKNRIIRGKDEKSVDRFDTFWCMIASDIFVYRHQGTIDGAIKTNQYSSPEYAQKNNVFMRVLQHGPTITDKPLVCHMSGNIVEDVPTWNPLTKEYCPINRYEIHHSKYTSNTSFYLDINTNYMTEKIVEPSSYLRKWVYTEFTTQMVAELLSTIVLSTGEHKALHNLPISGGGINYWIDGVKSGAYTSIPYAWSNEQNYAEVLGWISANCPNVDTLLLPSYDDFVLLHSTN